MTTCKRRKKHLSKRVGVEKELKRMRIYIN